MAFVTAQSQSATSAATEAPTPWPAQALSLYGVILVIACPLAAFLLLPELWVALAVLEIGLIKALACFAAAHALKTQAQSAATLADLHRLAIEDGARGRSSARAAARAEQSRDAGPYSPPSP